MHYCGFILATALFSGCRHETVTPRAELPPTRVVATLYQVDADAVPCYRIPDTRAPVVSVLNTKQLVELVALKEGTLHRQQRYWLHVHPQLNPKTRCYMDVTHLIPLS